MSQIVALVERHPYTTLWIIAACFIAVLALLAEMPL